MLIEGSSVESSFFDSMTSLMCPHEWHFLGHLENATAFYYIFSQHIYCQLTYFCVKFVKTSNPKFLPNPVTEQNVCVLCLTVSVER